MNRDHKQKEVQHNALRLLLQNRPIRDDRKVQQNVRSVALPGSVRSFFRGLGGSIQKVGGAVMLHFAQKLGADAQIHVFVGNRSWHFQVRRINHL